MTYEQLIKEIMQLPVEERLELLEVTAHSLREDMQMREHRKSAVSRLRGIIKFDGETPTDEELKEHYAHYLTEKYS